MIAGKQVQSGANRGSIYLVRWELNKAHRFNEVNYNYRG